MSSLSLAQVAKSKGGEMTKIPSTSVGSQPTVENP